MRNEAAEEESGGDRAGKAAFGGVDHVGHVRFQHVVVPVPQGQAPDGIVLGRARGKQGAGERLVIGEERRQVRAERYAGGAGQRREIEDQVGGMFAGAGQRVAQDQPAFGIGVRVLDGQALAGAQHVARAEGCGGHRVLDRGDEEVEADGQARGHDQAGERDGVGGAAHVLLHQAHRGGRLDIEAAGVEAHALADDGEAGMRGVAPGEFDQAGCTLRRGGDADRVDHRIVAGQRLPLRHRDLRAEAAGEFGDFMFQLGGAEIAGRGVDQIADLRGGRRDAHGFLDMRGVAGQEDALPGRLAGLVAGEAILAEQPAERGGTGVDPLRSVDALRQYLRKSGKCPGRVRIGDGGDDLPVAFPGDDQVRARLAREARGGGLGANRLGLVMQPCPKVIRRDRGDGARILAAIGLQQKREVGRH